MPEKEISNVFCNYFVMKENKSELYRTGCRKNYTAKKGFSRIPYHASGDQKREEQYNHLFKKYLTLFEKMIFDKNSKASLLYSL